MIPFNRICEESGAVSAIPFGSNQSVIIVVWTKEFEVRIQWKTEPSIEIEKKFNSPSGSSLPQCT